MDLNNINHYFDKVYVITLDREEDRHEHIVKNLQDLNYTIFYGVDKKELALDDLIYDGIYDEDKAIAVHRYDKPMNTGLVGRSLSHRLVYEDMIKNKYQKILILEDEAIPSKEGIDLLENSLDDLPANWELLYLDCSANLKRDVGAFFKQLGLHISHLFGKLKWTHGMINNLYARKHSANILKAGMHGCSNAYAITLSAAKKLVELQTPVCFPPADLLAYACTNQMVNGFVFQPNAFKQHAFLKTKTLID